MPYENRSVTKGSVVGNRVPSVIPPVPFGARLAESPKAWLTLVSVLFFSVAAITFLVTRAVRGLGRGDTVSHTQSAALPKKASPSLVPVTQAPQSAKVVHIASPVNKTPAARPVVHRSPSVASILVPHRASSHAPEHKNDGKHKEKRKHEKKHGKKKGKHGKG